MGDKSVAKYSLRVVKQKVSIELVSRVNLG